MHLRTTIHALFAAALLCTCVLLLPASQARAASIDTDIEPPSPIYEVNPGTRPGYIWSDGCWLWDGERHRWHPGYWVAERSGETWVPDNWEKRGKKWHFVKAHWEAADDQQAADKPADDATDATADAATATPAKTTPCKTHCKAAPRPAPAPNYNDQQTWPSFIHH